MSRPRIVHKCAKLDEIEYNVDSYTRLDSEELGERHLWLLTNAYDNLGEWKTLATLLDLSTQDVDLIEFNYLSSVDGLRECFYQCLLKWRLIQPENCHFSYLCKVLTSKKLAKSLSLIERLAQTLLRANEQQKDAESRSMLASYIRHIQAKNEDKKYANTSVAEFNLAEKHLWSASEIICAEWKSISRCLGVKESDLMDIQARYARHDGIRECSYQSLLLWTQIYASSANLEHFCLTLISMRFNLFAKQLLEKLLFN